MAGVVITMVWRNAFNECIPVLSFKRMPIFFFFEKTSRFILLNVYAKVASIEGGNSPLSSYDKDLNLHQNNLFSIFNLAAHQTYLVPMCHSSKKSLQEFRRNDAVRRYYVCTSIDKLQQLHIDPHLSKYNHRGWPCQRQR